VYEIKSIFAHEIIVSNKKSQNSEKGN